MHHRCHFFFKICRIFCLVAVLIEFEGIARNIMKKEIILSVELDSQNVPEKITWGADDGNGQQPCDAFMISIWDSAAKETLGIDLWAKEMMVADMNIFVYQSLKKMADTYQKATQNAEAAALIREFARDFGKKTELLKTKS